MSYQYLKQQKAETPIVTLTYQAETMTPTTIRMVSADSPVWKNARIAHSAVHRRAPEMDIETFTVLHMSRHREVMDRLRRL